MMIRRQFDDVSIIIGCIISISIINNARVFQRRREFGLRFRSQRVHAELEIERVVVHRSLCVCARVPFAQKRETERESDSREQKMKKKKKKKRASKKCLCHLLICNTKSVLK